MPAAPPTGGPPAKPAGWRHAKSGAQPLASAARRALIRLHASPEVRRLIPAPLMFALIDAYVARAGRRGNHEYQDAVKFAATLLRYTPQAGHEQALAPRIVSELWRSIEIFWRPWLMQDASLEGAQHLDAAQASRRGIVTAFPHFGLFYAQFPAMRRFGIQAWVIAPPGIPDGYLGHFARQGWRYIDMLGPGRAIVRPGVYETAVELLRDGKMVSVAFDIAGHMPTPFLGRTTSLASGSSKLACDADALVLPFMMARRGSRPVLRFAPALDCRDFSTPEELQGALAEVIEGWVLERPESVWPLQQHQGGLPLINGPALGAPTDIGAPTLGRA